MNFDLFHLWRLKREFIDTIMDPNDKVKIIFTIIDTATENIQILFYNYAALQRLAGLGLLKYLGRLRSGNYIDLDILRCVKDRKEIKKIEKELSSFKDQGYEKLNLFQFRYLTKNSFESKITTFIADSMLSLVLEMKDSNVNDTFEDSVSITNYSNNQSTVYTISIIFENLWNQSEIEMKAIS